MLKLVDNRVLKKDDLPFLSQRDLDIHETLLSNFLDSHRIKGHSPQTIINNQQILRAWFKFAGNEERHLCTFEAMVPTIGRQRIRDYSRALVASGLASSTIRGYLITLFQYFEFVLDHPFVTSKGEILDLKKIYGDLVQPVSRHDMPTHSLDREIPLPMDPARLYEWFAFIREHYLNSAKEKKHKSLQARNYAMIVLAAEAGLRIDELTHLSVDDLFFDSHRVQTRHAKGTMGSGKRSRTTLFPLFSRHTLKHYLEHHRPVLMGSKQSKRLFPSVNSGILHSRHSSRIMNKIVECSIQQGFPVAEHMSWHWLRRIFATRFIERFPDKLPILLNLLGHSNFATVHRYIKHSEAFMDKEIMAIMTKVESWQSNGH
jgi:site-specific recombinase XerD